MDAGITVNITGNVFTNNRGDLCGQGFLSGLIRAVMSMSREIILQIILPHQAMVVRSISSCTKEI
jgi:hypothetical protein